MSTPAPALSTLSTDFNWLKSHLILLIVIAALIAGSVYGIESLIAKHDAQRVQQDQQVLMAVTNQTNDLKARMMQDEQQEATRDAQYNQTIAQLSAIISNQSTQLQKQIKTNATLTAVQTAAALTTKTKSQPGEITATGDNVTLDLSAARTVNSDIDTLATTQSQLIETKKQLDAQTSLTIDANLDVTNAENVIASQQNQINIGNKTCQDQVSLLKVQARKSKIKWFFAGLITGFGLAHPLGI